jgi:hypothetical protein
MANYSILMMETWFGLDVGVPYMVSLLNGPSETISVNCCKAITNYANKGTKCLSIALQEDVFANFHPLVFFFGILDPINSALCNAGYNGIIALLRKVADKVPVLQLMANSVTTGSPLAFQSAWK